MKFRLLDSRYKNRDSILWINKYKKLKKYIYIRKK